MARNRVLSELDRHDRDFHSYEDTADGPAKRITGSLGVTPSGLNTAGKITEISISSSGWTALPASPLANRNAISIQNRSGGEIKINYDNGVSGYTGVVIPNGGERYYDITDSIVIYAKSQSGTRAIVVEELS